MEQCILWDNVSPHPDQDITISTGSPLLGHNDIAGGLPAGAIDTGGNFDLPPLFLDTLHEDYRLSSASPCVDAGDPGFILDAGQTDPEGERRVIGGAVGIGADEFNSDCNANGRLDPIDIAQGVSADCDHNHIPDECFNLQRDCNGNGIADACEILGGLVDDCNGNGIPDSCTLLDPDCDGNGVPDSCDIDREGGDCNRDGIPDRCQLELGMLSDCNGNQVPDCCDVAREWSPDVDHNGIPDECQNVLLVADGVYAGPGNKDLSFAGKDITVMSQGGPWQCIIDCEGSGRGFSLTGGETILATILGFSILNGHPDGYGGAIHCLDSSPSIWNCVISGNTSTYWGGGVYINTAQLPFRVRNSLITGNAAVFGAGMYAAISNYNHTGFDPAEVLNCTFYGNSAVYQGAGMMIYTTSCAIEISNSIYWGNTGSSNLYANSGKPALVSNSVVENGVNSFFRNGGGILKVDPQFLDSRAGNFRLSSGSSAIDAGDPAFLPLPGETDLDLMVRVDGGVIDIGAFETLSDCNGNGRSDATDLAIGSSKDCDSNGVPDECELVSAACPYARGDVNNDGVIDRDDILQFIAVFCREDVDPCHVETADMNRNGRIGRGDAKIFEYWIRCQIGLDQESRITAPPFQDQIPGQEAPILGSLCRELGVDASPCNTQEWAASKRRLPE